MATEDIKEYLVNYNWLDTDNVSDLKRVAKFTQNTYIVRMFENKNTGKKGYVVTLSKDHEFAERNPDCVDTDTHANFWEAGPTYFGVYVSEFEHNELCVSFAPKSFFDREGCIPDWHNEDVIEALFGISNGPYYFDECCENMHLPMKDGMYLTGEHKQEVIDFLISKGLEYNQALDFEDNRD